MVQVLSALLGEMLWSQVFTPANACLLLLAVALTGVAILINRKE